MTAPALPFAGDTSKIHGYTISQWHQIAMNAAHSVATNPNDRNAHDALDYAHNAIQAYAGGRLHNKAVAGAVTDEQGMDPGSLAADASHALNTATLGLANQVGGPNWRAFQQLGEDFQPSASARGDIAGGAVTAKPVGELAGKFLGPAIRPVAQAIGAGFSSTAGAGAVAQSALGSGAALGVPSAIGGFFANPDGSTLDRLKQAGQEGLGGFLLGSTIGGLAGYGTRASRLEALDRQANVARNQSTIATAPETAARAPLQTQIAQERANQAPLRTGIVQEQAAQAPMRTDMLQQRLENMQNNPGRPIQGQASAGDVGGGTSAVGGPVPDAGTLTGPEANLRAGLAKMGRSPAEIEEAVSRTKARGMMPGTAPSAPQGPAVSQAAPVAPQPSVAAPVGSQSPSVAMPGAGRPVIGSGAKPEAMWRELMTYPLTAQIQGEMGPALQAMDRGSARQMMAHVAQADAFGSIPAPWRDFLLTNLQQAGK